VELNRCVLKAVLKLDKVPESRMEAGILFQADGAETASECLCKWRGGMRPVQDGSSVRAQWLM